MSVSKPILTRRALLMAGVETVYGQAVATNPANDSVLVTDPRWSGDVNYLTRNLNRASLSPMPSMAGRKTATMTFSTEVRGNGIHQNLTAATLPQIARLMRGCGFAVNLLAAPVHSPVRPLGVHPNAVAWATGGTIATITEPLMYVVEVTTGGASAAVKVSITSPVPGESSTNVSMPSAAPLPLGTKGGTATPTYSGNLVEGQKWVFYIKPKGAEVVPVSTGFESLTLRLNIDDVLYVMTGAMGSFSISARAGELGTINWSFTGRFVEPTDSNMPANAVYEKALPGMFELAQLSIDGFSAIVENFSLDTRTDIQVRPDANSSEGYLGSRIVGRAPTMGIDPEVTQVSEHNFWGKLANAQTMPFTTRFGKEPGNTIYLMAPSVQYSGLSAGDRNGIATYAADLAVSGVNGDDELSLLFC